MTKEEAFRFLAKTMIPAKDLTGEVQEKLFKIGFEWIVSGAKVVRNARAGVIVAIDRSGKMYTDIDISDMLHKQYTMITVNDILSIKLDDVADQADCAVEKQEARHPALSALAARAPSSATINYKEVGEAMNIMIKPTDMVEVVLGEAGAKIVNAMIDERRKRFPDEHGSSKRAKFANGDTFRASLHDILVLFGGGAGMTPPIKSLKQI